MPHELINMQATGLRIKNLSTKYGYTRNFLADALNISPNAITHYYSGKHMPTIDNLLILSNLFMLPIEELLILNETASFSYNHFPAYTLHSLGPYIMTYPLPFVMILQNVLWMPFLVVQIIVRILEVKSTLRFAL